MIGKKMCRLWLWLCLLSASTFMIFGGVAQAVTRLEELGTTDLVPGPDGNTENIAVNPVTNTIYAQSGNGVSVIDGATRMVTGQLQGIFSSNQNVAVDATRNLIYTLNNNSLAVFDGANNRYLNTVAVGRFPRGLAVNAATNRIYVTNQDDDTVSVINGAGLTVVATVAVGDNPAGIAVDSSDRNKIYVANGDGSDTAPRTVSVINGADNRVSSLSLGIQPGLGAGYGSSIGVNTNTHKVYVGLLGSVSNYGDKVAVIDGDTNAVSTVQVSSGTTGGGPWRVVVDSTQNKIYVSLINRTFMAVINGADNSVTQVAFPDGLSGQGLAVDATRNTVYAGEYYSVHVVDGATQSRIARISMSSVPEAVAVNRSTGKVYITNSRGNFVSVVNGATRQVIKHIPISNSANSLRQPRGIAVDSTRNKIYVTVPYGGSLITINGDTDTIERDVPVLILVSSTVDGNGVRTDRRETSRPSSVAVNETTNTIYVGNQGDYPSLSVIDGANGQVDETFRGYGLNRPLGIAIDQTRDLIYVSDVTNANGTKVQVIRGNSYNPNALSLASSIDVTVTGEYGTSSGALAVNSVTNKIYVAINTAVRIVDGATFEAGPSIPLKIFGTYAQNGAGVAVNEADNRIYVAAHDQSSSALGVYSGSTNQLLSAVSAPRNTGAIIQNVAFNSANKRVYTVGAYNWTIGGSMSTAFDGLDSTPPTVSIGQPISFVDSGFGTTYGGFYRSVGDNPLSAASGIIQDDRSNVTSVQVKLHRDARGSTPAGWWAGGSTWTATYSDASNLLNATLTTGGTTYESWTLTLPTLAQGFVETTYQISARGSDEVGNRSTFDTETFEIDNTPPTIAITQPQNGASYFKSDAALQQLRGTMSDAASGVGQSNYVNLHLSRVLAGSTTRQYWNGGQWAATEPQSPPFTLTPSNPWAYDLPANLAASAYAVYVTSSDNAGNQGTSNTVNFSVIEPSLSLSIATNPATDPVSFSEAAGNQAAVGTVSIPAALSSNLEVTLSSSSTDEATVPSSVTIVAGQTSKQFDITAVDDTFVDGSQDVTITASAGGYIPATSQVIVTDNDTSGDTTAPVVSITSPANNSTQSTLATISGSATDNVGVTRMQIAISKDDGTANGQYWNGSAFTATPYGFALTPPGANGAWTFNGGPNASQLTPGTYFLDFYAYDAANRFGYASSRVTVTAPAAPTLSLSLAQSTLSEGAATTGTVQISVVQTSDLPVTLSSSDASAATVPTNVVIAAGQTSATFALTAVDDDVADGTQSSIITAAHAGLTSATAIVSVTDTDTAALSLALSADSVVEGGSVTGTITRNFDLVQPLNVQLSSTNADAANLPATLSIPAGAASAQFTINTTDDAIATGARNASIIARTSTLASEKPLIVADNEEAALTLSVSPTSFVENAVAPEGGAVARGRVTRNTPTAAVLTVGLASSDVSEARVSTSVTIAVGQTSAEFIITPQNDAFADGTRVVTLSASASGFTPGTARVSVTDDEKPALTLTIAPSRVNEGGTAAVATLSRNNEITSSTPSLSVALVQSPTGQLQIPASVSIPARAASVRFNVAAVNDTAADGPRVVTVTANKSGFVSGKAEVVAGDNEAASNLSISGKIVVSPTLSGATTAVGVPGATLTLRNGTGVLDVVLSNASGNYSFTRLPRGTYSITPSKPDYSFAPTSLSVALPQAATVAGAPNAINRNFVGTPRTVIRGKVTQRDSAGRIAGMAGVVVRAQSTLKAVTTITARDGSYTLSGLPLGVYVVLPIKPGTLFNPTFKPVALSALSPTAGNVDFIVAGADTVAPKATIALPTASSFTTGTLGTLKSITVAATATDNKTNGVALVTVQIAKFSSASDTSADGFLNWSSATPVFSAYNLLLHEKLTVFRNGKYELTDAVALALLRSLPAGFYGVRATALDNASNFGLSAFKRFAVTTPATRGAGELLPSSVRVSTAAASASDSSITVVFTGALDDTAADAARYGVEVNGESVEIESVSLDAARATVKLGLPEGSLRSGDEIVLRWNELSDARGRLLSQPGGLISVR